jgi:hypothetical protein
VVDFEDLKTNPFSVNWNSSNNHCRDELGRSNKAQNDLHHGQAIRRSGCWLPSWHWQGKIFV